MKPILLLSALSLAASRAPWGAAEAAAPSDPCILERRFIVDNPPFPSSHASTIVETPEGLVAAWFGGSQEGALDVSIWVSRHDGTGWGAPEEVARGDTEDRFRRYPCWNPVLFRRSNGDLLLFYKVGPSPESWWGMVRLSPDNGKTWTRVRRLPTGYVGPVRNKPIELADGTLLCGSSSEDRGWRVHLEWTRDPFGLWSRSPVLNSALSVAAIQPTLLRYEGGFQMLCRTKQGRIYESRSYGNFLKWTPLTRTVLPNPSSAVDAARLRDGRVLLVYNHSTTSREVLNVAVSYDEGSTWEAVCELEREPGSEFSYPAVIQASDGRVHITYTWKRQRIRHAVLDPALIRSRPMADGAWR